jgi:hypothetical protein
MTELISVVVANIVNRIKPAFANYIACRTAPLMRVLNAYTCNCHTNDTGCFDFEPVSAKGVLWSHMVKTFISRRAQITTYNETIPDSADQAVITVNETDTSDALRRRDTISVVDSESHVIGEVIGDGVNVQIVPAAVAPFQLCITMDTTVVSTFETWDVAQVIGSSIVALGTGQVIDGSVCADVQDNAIYYSVKTTPYIAPNTGSAASISASILLFIVALMI